MIFGIGTDLCDIRRIQATWERRGDSLARKILGAQEYSEFETRRSQSEIRAVQFLASRFAGKEAFSKAIGMGFRPPMGWHNCEILPNHDGKPTVSLHHHLYDWFAQQRLQAHISLSDEVNYAMAFVVIERME